MNGPLIVTLSRSKDKLMVSYQKKDRVVHEEEFEKSTIKEISLQKIDQKSFTSYLQPESATMRINFSDSDRNLFLFEFGGRPLFFAPSSIQKVQNFLQENDVNLSSYSRTGSG